MIPRCDEISRPSIKIFWGGLALLAAGLFVLLSNGHPGPKPFMPRPTVVNATSYDGFGSAQGAGPVLQASEMQEIRRKIRSLETEIAHLKQQLQGATQSL